MKKFFLFLTTLLITSATQAALHVYAFPIPFVVYQAGALNAPIPFSRTVSAQE